MSEPRRGRRTLAILLGLGSSLVFLYLAFRRIDLHGVGDALLHSDWWPWYVMAPFIYYSGHIARGQRCRVILEPHCDISLMTGINCTIIGYAANNLLPARMGEVVRAYVLGRRANVSVSLALAVTFLERIFDGLSITLILVIAGHFAPLPDWGKHVVSVALIVFAGASVAVALLTAARPLVRRIAATVTSILPEGIAHRLLGILDRAFGATDCLRSPHILLMVLLLSMAAWLCEGTMFLTVLPAFRLPMNPLWAAMALSISNLATLVPSSPGYIGPFHYFCMQAIRMFGVPQETALGYAIMVHLLFYIPVTIYGMAALAYYGISLNKAAESEQSAE